MAWEIWFTLSVVALVLFLLSSTPAPTEVVLLGAMIVLSVAGVISPHQALSGFSSPGVMTVAALYVVVAGLRETGTIAAKDVMSADDFWQVENQSEEKFDKVRKPALKAAHALLK